MIQSLVVIEANLFEQEQLKRKKERNNNLTQHDLAMWHLTLSCDLEVRHNAKVALADLHFFYTCDESFVMIEVQTCSNKSNLNKKVTFLLIWPQMTLSRDLSAYYVTSRIERYNVKVSNFP